LVITDADAGQVKVFAQSVPGTYGTIAVDEDGAWTFTANGAHNALKAGEVVNQSLTVTSQDNSATGVITVNITGTNDVPVLETISERTFVQGNLAVDNFRTVSATDVDSAEITYHLADTFGGIFAIDRETGQISLANAGKVAALEGSNAGFDLVVTAQDGLGVSSSKTMHVTIDMAVEGTTASLPGGVGDWTIAPVAGGKPGYVFTNTADTSIKVFIPAGVTNISFEGGGSLGLAANGSITDTTTTMAHTIRITEGAAVGDEVVLSTTNASQVTVIGQANAAVTDGVKIAADINVNSLDAIFSVDASKTITVGGAAINPINIANVGLVNAVIADVEYVQFNNAKVLIVGAGGYATLSAASAAAESGDVIYVANPALANGDAGMINNTKDISIYIAKGDEPVNMTMLNAGQEVRIYGTHAFTLNGSVGADTVHDYTVLAAGKTNYIYGMDGADILVSHSTDSASRILSGGSGADKLIGGTAVQLLGGDGNDTLLSFGGAAILSGGAGDDILLNAYGSKTIDPATGKVVLQTVNMTGGSGTDTFGLIGSADASQSGVMRTLVTDLGTGDKIDLSFVEGGGRSIDTAADFTAASLGNKATMTTAGTTLTFDKTMFATSAEAGDINNDTNTQMQAGSLVLSNATLTKVSAAMTAGKDSLTGSVPDFNTAFTPLTDTYNHHG
jgi:VCBS repeat-containing protein